MRSATIERSQQGLIGGATALVVASDAPAAILKAAHALKASMGSLVQICDGTADETQINAAIEAVANGYSTGTISISNTTVTGSGTTFTSDMVGWYLRTSDNNAIHRVAAFTDTTHLTLDKSATAESGVTYMLNRPGIVKLSAGNFNIDATPIDKGKYSGIRLEGAGYGKTRLTQTATGVSVIKKTSDFDGQDNELIGFEAVVKTGVTSTVDTIDLTNATPSGKSRNWKIDDIEVNNSAAGKYGFAATDCRTWEFGYIHQRYGGGFMKLVNYDDNAGAESSGNFHIEHAKGIITTEATVTPFLISGGDSAGNGDYMELFHISLLDIYGKTNGVPLLQLYNVRRGIIDSLILENDSGSTTKWALDVSNGSNLYSYGNVINKMFLNSHVTTVTVEPYGLDIVNTITFNECDFNNASIEIGDISTPGDGIDNGSWGIILNNCENIGLIKGYCTVKHDRACHKEGLNLEDLYAPAAGFSDNTCYVAKGCVKVVPDDGTAIFTSAASNDSLITYVGGTDNYVAEWFVNHLRGKAAHRYGPKWRDPYYETVVFQIDTEDNDLADTEVWIIRGDKDDDYVGIKILNGSVYMIGSEGPTATDTGVDIAEGDMYTLFINKNITSGGACDYGFAIRGYTKIDAGDYADQATYLGTLDEDDAPDSAENVPTYILSHYMQTTDDGNQYLQSRIFDFEFLEVNTV